MAFTFVLIDLEMTLMVRTPMYPSSVPRIELYLTSLEIALSSFKKRGVESGTKTHTGMSSPNTISKIPIIAILQNPTAKNQPQPKGRLKPNTEIG